MDFTPLPQKTPPQNPATRPPLTPELLQTLASKVAAVEDCLRRVVREHAPVAFANSLGAEDMALTDMILKNALPIRIFTLDTGRLHPETCDLLADAERHYGRRFEVFYPEHTTLERFVHTYGINAFYASVAARRQCCHIRKVEPLRRALAGCKAWITGMRAQQSATRQGLAVQEFDAGHGLEKFNPLADWSEKEVWAYIRSNDVPYNPLHDQFYPSIGCAPCTRALATGEDIRAGRWWWENPETKECGLHAREKQGEGHQRL
ncbi:MAG: phosphoadenylyl-sulfate reductase [Zoogloeaceae bacterium]|jgi:phosphoadenosine phosphosulfate reductase|nr:phosphoadenylyl-sulfate reductase [Zoogloeaceae bacterium]